MISTLHISPHGSDQWNGLQAHPNDDRTDGPLATFQGAIRMVRLLREQNMTIGSVSVMVQPGRYEISAPLHFGPLDCDMTFVATGPGAVVTSGRRVRDWKVGLLNERVCWTADIASLLSGREIPKSLHANGELRPRSRFPKEGWLIIEDVPDHGGRAVGLFDAAASRFKVREGDFDPRWRNLEQIEAVVNHLWIEERMPVQSFDADRQILHSTHRSIFSLRNAPWMGETPCARYYLENVFETMSEPGEWYADVRERRLYYLPKEGESPDNTTIVLPILTQLVRCHGDLDQNLPVRGIHFKGLTFEGTDWTHPDGWGRWWDPSTKPHEWRRRDSFSHFEENDLAPSGLPPCDRVASVPQAAHDLPGAVSFEKAENCSVTDCTLRNLGFYGIDVRGGCRHLRIQGNSLGQLGGGGVKVDGASATGDQRLRTSHVYIGDNTIHDGGLVFAASVGILSVHADHITIEHNLIHRLFYTGISVGWVWGYEQNSSHANVVQFNHIHDIGMGRLSDMGGIYTLGVQPGTLIKGNLVHDVRGSHYGGWGIYLDHASSFITVEQNIVHHTNSQCFNEHWGRSNLVRDNIFALPAKECVQLCREEQQNFVQHPAKGCLFLGNVFLTDGRAAFLDCMKYFESGILRSDMNLFWDLDRGKAPVYCAASPWDSVVGDQSARELTLEDAKTSGLELRSVATNPQFANPRAGDFRLPPESALPCLGFRLLDQSKCGPRPTTKRDYQVDKSFKRGGPVAFGD